MEIDIENKKFINTSKFENPADYENIDELMELYNE